MDETRATETVLNSSPTGVVRLFAPGSEVGSRYEIREVLGSGGFAVVYRAWDRTVRREVALKVLRPDRMASEALRRFRREVAVARDVDSPRLVRIFDISESPEAVYYSMELVDGESLRGRLSRGPLASSEAARLAAQVLEGLAALHGVGVVHRDVKPANILLTEAGEAKLCDFGLARELDATHSVATETENVVGTLDYLSPEQALGGEVDGRADLYALGCVLFEALTGSVPHKGRTSVGTLVAHVNEAAPHVRSLRPDVPEALDALVARLLEKKPARRPPGARAALADLATGRPRRPWKTAVGAVAALAVVAAFALVVRGRSGIRLSFREPEGIIATDARGAVLWKHANVRFRGAAVFRTAAGRMVAAIEDGKAMHDPAFVRRLLVLDGRTGARRRTVALPEHVFLGFADHFAARVAAADLDGDGFDEVLVTYVHDPYWPSYTVLWEPGIDRTRTVFVGSGHHEFAGAADLDGEGKKELLFSGTANRLGWYGGVAAVRPAPAVNVAGEGGAIAGTPDLVYGATPGKLWYALLPRYVGTRLDVDPRARTLTFTSDGERAAMTFAGFAPGASFAPSRDEASRQRAREEVYAGLRDASPLLSSGDAAGALARLAPLREPAAAAGDAVLAEWLERVEVRALIEAGRGAEAEPGLSALLERGFAPRESVLGAARAYHLRGDLADAARWYRRALRKAVPATIAHGPVAADLLTGEVLALAEMGAWDEAQEEAQRFRVSFPDLDSAALHLASWVAWRRGLTTGVGFLPDPRRGATPDLFAVTWLEARLASGEPAAAVEKDLPAVLAQLSDLRPVAVSLGAELAARRGAWPEAVRAARGALEEARLGTRREVTLRAHLDLVAERAAGIARRAGDRALEADARRERARVARETKRERARYLAARGGA